MATEKLTMHEKLQTATFMLIEAGHLMNELGGDLNVLSDKIHKLRELNEGKAPGQWACESCPVRDFANLDAK